MRVTPILLLVAILAVPVPAMSQNAASQAMSDAMNKMMSAMHMAPSGNVDMDFAMMMKPHHQGAIDMAKVELQYGTDPELKAMAQKIIDAQTAEIAEFDAWLAKHM